jgi:flagellar FliL protein
MSTATAENAEVVEAPAKKFVGKKKLLILAVLALLVLALAAGGGLVLYKKRKAAREAAEADGDAAAQVEAQAAHKHDAKHAPTFVPLEMFTVNLADKEAERYAQIGITLQIEDAKVADDIKAYMPAIRHNILMVLAGKTSQDLLAREGKERLAFEVKREAARALGIEIQDELAPKTAASGAKPAKRVVYEPSPIEAVQFSNFIIQ